LSIASSVFPRYSPDGYSLKVPVHQGKAAASRPGRFSACYPVFSRSPVDCIPQNLRSWRETLCGFGLTVPLDVLQLYSDKDGDDTLQILAPNMGKDFRKRVLKAEGAYFEAKYLRSVRAFKGIRPSFEALKRAGGKIAIATDCLR
jgi:hypothetical protein